ncbi:PREDICTED: laminin subunit gamma-1-like [Nicrophorus vespilloides]|uniref:Laminin subunit gamma-1-like n=1 Tax=Nicrophorus vespilloides TaxID=110193 RepID=A0ABM1M3M4_NICVS|nr:PREDICTED: laminin subunit gamma-1-like [Nicrophorus vespilloides]
MLMFRLGILLVSCALHSRWIGAHEIRSTPVLGQNGTRCYDSFNRPQRCIPAFENPAFNNLIEATNTCGENGPTPYCIQTGTSMSSCDVCTRGQHSAEFLTDSEDTPTWWQSETMEDGIQYPNEVNLTLHLRKSFDITYVRLWFHSPRPESFAIYKRSCEDCPWIPYQYYSATCRDTYSLPDSNKISRGDETRALCTSEYSDISPLKDGNIAFATLEFRPSAYNFDSSPELQEWVTATDIRITLNRLNTFGDELFSDTSVLRSYYYSIVEVSVGARCKCNGHSSECIYSSDLDGSQNRVCKCEHNTAGPDCEVCLPFFNDAPWGRASERNANECKPCNCNGFSQRCFFDKELYQRTGHGGHCLDCLANRDGPNCERCKENYYQREDQSCIACNCDPVGSRSLQCSSEGKCQCKPGVTGAKCDRCDANHYQFGPNGCKSCGCSIEGSSNNQPSCDPYTGICSCKENVEGKRCKECKPGFFNLDSENDFGCTPCFCYGHSSECVSAPSYSKYQLVSAFTKSNERWKGVDSNNRSIALQYNGLTQSIGATSLGSEAVYFLAPDRYLGDQRASYNQLLTFTLRIGENRAIPTPTDIILEGAGTYITNHIFAQGNAVPSLQNYEYTFRLHESHIYGWSPRLSARAFMSILTQLTAIKIRGTYSPGGVGFLAHVKLETASRGVAGRSAHWVEQCRCPQGYVGQYCESCAPGYRHSPSLGGPFMPCIPCDCNKHAEICDSETGRCICQHHTAGDNCERCARGYYGNALSGTNSDCLSCGCPNGGACIQLDEDTVCVECPVGYTGHRCDSCSDGYFGDPSGRFGQRTPCQQCDCNLNIDPNAIGNCNTTTGECLKCIHNTEGYKCDRCLSGFYGDALSLPKGDCQPCRCMPHGTFEGRDGNLMCDQFTGSCNCKPHVHGKNCDLCEDGYYNIVTGEGCSSCNCDSVGSFNHTCNIYSGQCFCRPGITGLRCDQCETNKYGFSAEGCRDCECDGIGSQDMQCDSHGQCPCLENVEGRKCDRCKENKYDRQRGCVDCPDCYNLVRDASRRHLMKIHQLRSILDEIERNPTVIDDRSFEKKLQKIQDEVLDLNNRAKAGLGTDDKTLEEKLDEISKRQEEISEILEEINENILLAKHQDGFAQTNITETENILKDVSLLIENSLETVSTQGKLALERAQKRAKLFGQQSENMTKISLEARKLSDALENEAADILSVSGEAKIKSIEAYDLAKNLTDQKKNITQEIRSLNNDITNTEAKLERVKQWSVDAHKKSSDIKNSALSLLNDAQNLVVPEVDIDKLKKDSDIVNVDARAILDATEALLADNEKMLDEIDEQLNISTELLNRGNDQEESFNDLKADFDLYRSQAENAVKLGDNTLNDAQAMYATLSEFDKQVQESKEAAQQSLREIPEIRALIDEANDIIGDAQKLLLDAKENAESALDRAKNARDLAIQATKDAENVKLEVEVMSNNATDLKTEAELMADRVENTANEFRRLLEQTGSNDTLLNLAKDKVGIAQKDSQDATKKVHDILKEVEAIVKELDNLPDFDEEELNRLEQNLRNAEQRVKDANLEEILRNLQIEQKEQNALVESYNEEIKRLSKEVENIEQIAAALPEGCFRKFVLEP